MFQVLDCFTIPTVLFCSRCFLGVRYKWLHIVGVFICLVGVAALIAADVLLDRHSGDGNVLKLKILVTREFYVFIYLQTFDLSFWSC